MIPPAKRDRKRTVDVREVRNPIFHALATDCQWKALPKEMPAKSAAHAYIMLWDWNGALERIHDTLYVATRETIGKEPGPTAAIIDSRSHTAAQNGARRLIRRVSTLARRSRAGDVGAKAGDALQGGLRI